MDGTKPIERPVVVPLGFKEHRLLKALASAANQPMGIYVARLVRTHLAENELAKRLGKVLAGSDARQKG